MSEERINDYDRVWEVLKRAVDEMKAEGIPDHEMPPAVADFLMFAVIAMGQSSHLSAQAGRTIIQRMEQTLQDYLDGKYPFESLERPPPISEDEMKTADFVISTLVNFVRCYFSTLDQEFVATILKGKPEEFVAEALVESTINDVRGNRPGQMAFTGSDLGIIMDKIAALHLQTRHGEESVSIPGITRSSE